MTPTNRTKIDWLNMVFPTPRLKDVLDMTDGWLGSHVDAPGQHTYVNGATWETKAFAFWSDERPECMLSLNGDSLDFFIDDAPLRLLSECEQIGGKATRIDLAYDDFTRQLLDLDMVNVAAHEGNYFGFKNFARHAKFRRTKGETLMLNHGYTFGEPGSTGSGKQVVFYDKNLQSKGQVNSIRIESRFFKQRADVIVQALTTAPNMIVLSSKANALIAGSIDFRRRTNNNDRHADRYPRLEWWERVVNALSHSTINVTRPIHPLMKSAAYHRFAYAKTLAAISTQADKQGWDGRGVIHRHVDLMISEGLDRLSVEPMPECRDLTLNVEQLLAPATD
jgi:hypothetical protein